MEDELGRRGVVLKRQSRELIGPCPVCGGTDRFAVNISKQVFNCRGCGKGGDVIALAQHLDGTRFPEAIATLTGGEDRPRRAPVTTAATKSDSATTSQGALRIWREGMSIIGTLAERYLAGRGIMDLPPDPDGVLRFHPRCAFGRGADGETIYHSCMLVLVRNVVSNAAQAIYRTALNTDATNSGAWPTVPRTAERSSCGLTNTSRPAL
jgi:hypothetical protein